ncbi:MAG: hypothetical protein ACREN4_09045 [Candidatus Dormibacteria bacterium]
MLHVIAFIVIGLVVGAIFIRQARAMGAVIRVVAALIGSFVGGFASLGILGSGHTSGKYGSLVIAVIVACIVAAISMPLTRSDSAFGRATRS